MGVLELCATAGIVRGQARPQGGHDRVHPLAAARPVGDLAAGEREPLPAAVVALEISPRIEGTKTRQFFIAVMNSATIRRRACFPRP